MPGNVNEIEADERIVEIEVERLREFRNHPFKVKADQQMLQLIRIFISDLSVEDDAQVVIPERITLTVNEASSCRRCRDY